MVWTNLFRINTVCSLKRYQRADSTGGSIVSECRQVRNGDLGLFHLILNAL